MRFAAALVVVALVATTAFAAKYRLVFEDDFDTLDLSKWEHELTLGGGGNWEFQYYANNRSTSFVREGALHLRPMLTSDVIGEANVRGGYRMDMWGSQPSDMCTGNAFYGCERTSGAGGNILNPIRSARVRTHQSINIKYGKVEVRAKLPKGDWIWPAIWLLPKVNSYGQWPASGEIDIMESRGNSPNADQQGVDYVASTLHWGPHFPENGYALTTNAYKIPSGTFNDDFHDFVLEWNEQGLRTSVDGNTLLNVDWTTQDFWSRGGWGNTGYDNPWAASPNKGAPFDQEYYLIMNVAVGGTNGYFRDGVGGKPWSNTSPNAVNEFYNALNTWYPTWSGSNRYQNAMVVDYVRIYTDDEAPGASYSPSSTSSNGNPVAPTSAPVDSAADSGVSTSAFIALAVLCGVAVVGQIAVVIFVLRMRKNAYTPLN